MRKRFSQEKHIIGVNGTYAEDAIASIFGQILQLLNCQMVQMDGSVSSSMESLQQCTQGKTSYFSFLRF